MSSADEFHFGAVWAGLYDVQALPSFRMLLLVLAQLAAFRRGYCDETLAGPSDCVTADQGAWPMTAHNTSAWTLALEDCRARCHSCHRCNYISVSLYEKECSWFNMCDMKELKITDRAEWRTERVRHATHNSHREWIDGIALRPHNVVVWPDQAQSSDVPLFIVSDSSASWILQENRGEALVKLVHRRVASKCLTKPNTAVVLDIGANAGYYGLIAAALGCRVVAFEPQPGCHKGLEVAIKRNGFHAMRLVKQAVGPKPQQIMHVPAVGCAMMGFTSSRPLESESTQAQVPTITVTDALNSIEQKYRILLIKIDVEGGEVNVLRALFDVMPVTDNLVIETSPGWWTERFKMNRSFGANLYASLFSRHGFELAYSSSGKWISNAQQMHEFIMSFGASGYWSQNDVWLGRDGKLMRRTIRQAARVN